MKDGTSARRKHIETTIDSVTGADFPWSDGGIMEQMELKGSREGQVVLGMEGDAPSVGKEERWLQRRSAMLERKEERQVEKEERQREKEEQNTEGGIQPGIQVERITRPVVEIA